MQVTYLSLNQKYKLTILFPDTDHMKLMFKLFITFFLFILCVHVCAWAYSCHGACVQVRGQFEGIGSLLLSYSSGDRTQIFKLDCKHLVSLSCTHLKMWKPSKSFQDTPMAQLRSERGQNQDVPALSCSLYLHPQLPLNRESMEFIIFQNVPRNFIHEIGCISVSFLPLHPSPLLSFFCSFALFYVYECFVSRMSVDDGHTWCPWMSVGENAGMTQWLAYPAHCTFK